MPTTAGTGRAGLRREPALELAGRAAPPAVRGSTPECSWATETGLDLIAYHDEEWGTPTEDAAALFEALALTYFENGLSWAVVFRKRSALQR